MAEAKIPTSDPTAAQLRAQYPSNSKLNKPEEKKSHPAIQTVANGVVIDPKKGIGARILKMFIAEDVHDIGRYLIEDVFVPGIKMAVISSLERLFFARSGYSQYRPYDYTKPRGGTHSTYAYGGYTSASSQPKTASDIPRDRSGLKYITFVTRREADDVLDEMNEHILKYGEVTVRDYYEASGVDSDFTDEKWGWRSLRGARCYPIRGGYAIELPPTEILE